MGCVKSKKDITCTTNNKKNYQIAVTNDSAYAANHLHSSCDNTNSRKNDMQRLTEASMMLKIKNNIIKNETKAEDNYKILCKLGKGAFGSVYKVMHNQTGVIRAMKVIKKESIFYQDDEKISLKEIEILSKVEHPNIIKIYEYFTDELNYYLITEYVSGGELYETIVKMNKFSERTAAYVMKQILSALNYLHSIDIVHRDIKPENMIVDKKILSDNFKNSSEVEEINIKLIDFGTCNYCTKDKNLTYKIGSPYYIAPEVLEKNYNKECDIWSAGVILYVLLIGHLPFSGKNKSDLFNQITKGEFRKKRPEWDQISSNAKDLITKMLEHNPKSRYTAEQCLNHPWISLANNNSEENRKILPNVLLNIFNLSTKEKLQQATMAYIVHSLDNSNEIETLKNAFLQLDTNNDGLLTYQEIKEGFEKVFGRRVTDIKLNQIFAEMDSDSNGVVSYEEFLRVSLSQDIFLDKKKLKAAFDRFDANKDGKLSREELKNVLNSSDFVYVDTLLKLIDENKDGYISFEEFENLMKGITLDCKLGKK